MPRIFIWASVVVMRLGQLLQFKLSSHLFIAACPLAVLKGRQIALASGQFALCRELCCLRGVSFKALEGSLSLQAQCCELNTCPALAPGESVRKVHLALHMHMVSRVCEFIVCPWEMIVLRGAGLDRETFFYYCA